MLLSKKLTIGILALVFSVIFGGFGVAIAQTNTGSKNLSAEMQKFKKEVLTIKKQSEIGKWAALACGLCIAIAAFGGALGQGRAAVAALEGIGRNPGAADKIFTPLILGLALIESLVIYALVISFFLYGKINIL